MGSGAIAAVAVDVTVGLQAFGMAGWLPSGSGCLPLGAVVGPVPVPVPWV